MAEVQQSSGITYRVWDWNRVDSSGNPRELHRTKSLDVINFNPKCNTPEYFKIMNGLFNNEGKKELLTHSAFKLSLVTLKKGQQFIQAVVPSKRLASVLNLDGEMTINGEKIESYEAVLFKDETKLDFIGLKDSFFLLIE
jgi:mannose-6-phosphate isomerase